MADDKGPEVKELDQLRVMAFRNAIVTLRFASQVYAGLSAATEEAGMTDFAADLSWRSTRLNELAMGLIIFASKSKIQLPRPGKVDVEFMAFSDPKVISDLDKRVAKLKASGVSTIPMSDDDRNELGDVNRALVWMSTDIRRLQDGLFKEANEISGPANRLILMGRTSARHLSQVGMHGPGFGTQLTRRVSEVKAHAPTGPVPTRPMTVRSDATAPPTLSGLDI